MECQSRINSPMTMDIGCKKLSLTLRDIRKTTFKRAVTREQPRELTTKVKFVKNIFFHFRFQYRTIDLDFRANHLRTFVKVRDTVRHRRAATREQPCECTTTKRMYKNCQKFLALFFFNMSHVYHPRIEIRVLVRERVTR